MSQPGAMLPSEGRYASRSGGERVEVKNPDAHVPGPSYVCPCRLRTSYWVRNQGFWHGLWWGVIVPLISLALIGGCLAVGVVGLTDSNPLLAATGFGVPGLLLLICFVVQAWEGHRWWCLVWRSVATMFLLPAMILGAFLSV